MDKKTFHVVSLGCAKNSVDSDSMAQLLLNDNYVQVDNAKKASVIVVNTCGFIQEAREQAYKELEILAGNKKPGQTLIAAGCLTQRYGTEVVRRIPEIDGILGTHHWMDIVDLVREIRQGKYPKSPYNIPENFHGNPYLNPMPGHEPWGILRSNIFGSSAYLKIADGCRRPCAFCAIPLIKGSIISRPMDQIVQEVKVLGEMGVKEINLIAQDTTDYGNDLGMKDGLSKLLEAITDCKTNIEWIRILYAYPGYVTERLIELMGSKPQILPYLDIPLQHAHPEVLKSMRRPADIEWIYSTLARMRNKIPGLAIRTTFIVGYPNETEERFQVLLDFIKEMRFDRVGVFKFSYEKGTASESLGDPISPEVKEDRFQRLMSLQQEISLQINQTFIGTQLEMLVEGQDEKKNISLGRSYRDAPEIDGLILAKGRAGIGDIVNIRVTGAMTYDLSGVVVGK